MQLLVFRIKNLYFGILTENIIEITRTLPYTDIPKSEAWVQGLVNLRGEVLTLVNLYSLLEMDDFHLEDCYNNTIVVQTKHNSIAVMVDEIIGVTDVDEKLLQTAAETDDTSISALVTLYDHVVNIIELNSLFEAIEG